MSASVVPRARSIVLGPDADEMRRTLGPLAWAALESLVTDTRPAAGEAVVHASIRSLADRLGVAKNTAHRAVSTLRRAGLLEHVPARTTNGQFATGTYRLTVDPDVLRPANDATTPPRTTTTRTSRHHTTNRRHHTDDTNQLSLLTP